MCNFSSPTMKVVTNQVKLIVGSCLRIGGELTVKLGLSYNNKLNKQSLTTVLYRMFAEIIKAKSAQSPRARSQLSKRTSNAAGPIFYTNELFKLVGPKTPKELRPYIKLRSN